MNRREIIAWLREDDPRRLEGLWRLADDARQDGVGDDVHLRGLLEISNHGVRDCLYYGLAIAYSLGIFERALGPFPAALDAYYKMRKAARRS